MVKGKRSELDGKGACARAICGTPTITYYADQRLYFQKTHTNSSAFQDPTAPAEVSSHPTRECLCGAQFLHCAYEGGFCPCIGLVRFGDAASGTWTTPTFSSAGMYCSTALFGDPVVGTIKTCECRARCESCASSQEGPQFLRLRPRLLYDVLTSYPPHVMTSAENWDADRQQLVDESGNGYSGSQVAGDVSTGTLAGHGAAIEVPFVGGDSSTKMQWDAASVPSEFTVCSITRYASAEAGQQKRILNCANTVDSSTDVNWLHGHWNGHAGATFYGRVDDQEQGELDHSIQDKTDWVVACGRNLGRPGSISTLINGVTTSTAERGYGNCALNINFKLDEMSSWQLSKLYIWDSHLPDDVFQVVSQTLIGYLAGTRGPECPHGYTMQEGVCEPEFCEPCRAGKFSSLANSAGCTSCVGHYQTLTGASVCGQCAPGKYARPRLDEWTPPSRYFAFLYMSDRYPGKLAILNPPEAARSYSTVWDNAPIGTLHARSMLDSPQSWSAQVNDVNQWMQIDLDETVYLAGIVCQGRTDVPTQFVQQVAVECNGVEIGTFNCSHGDHYKASLFPTPVWAQYIRIIPRQWSNHISMRAGLVQSLETNCTSCAPGFYSTDAGASSCAPCAPGFYSQETGATTCSACDAGRYSDAPGATTCHACSTNADSLSGTNCSCNAGYFGKGSVHCTACAAGKYGGWAVHYNFCVSSTGIDLEQTNAPQVIMGHCS